MFACWFFLSKIGKKLEIWYASLSHKCHGVCVAKMLVYWCKCIAFSFFFPFALTNGISRNKWMLLLCVGNIVSICHDFKCLLFSVGLYQLAHLQTNINKPWQNSLALINGASSFAAFGNNTKKQRLAIHWKSHHKKEHYLFMWCLTLLNTRIQTHRQGQGHRHRRTHTSWCGSYRLQHIT